MLTVLLLVGLLLVSTPRAANATTVATLISDFRSDFGQSDSTKGRFTNAQVRRLLTRATVRVAEILGEVRTDTSITLVASQTSYALPSDYWAFRSVWFKRTDDYIALQYVDPSQFTVDNNASSSSSYPQRFTVHFDSLSVEPVKPTYGSGEKLYVKYFANVSEFTNNQQTTELPLWTDNAVITWAIYFANERDYSVVEKLQIEATLTQQTIDMASKFARPELKPQQIQGAVQ